MPQGLRWRFGRAVLTGLGMVVFVGCNTPDPYPKPSTNGLPTAKQNGLGTTTQPQSGANGAVGTNAPRQFGSPGAGMQPGANGFQPAGAWDSGQPNPNNPGMTTGGTRMTNPATFAPQSPPANIVPPVGPTSSNVQPAGGMASPQSPMSGAPGGNTFQPAAGVSQQPNVISASYHKGVAEPPQPSFTDLPVPPSAPPGGTPSVAPVSPVTAPIPANNNPLAPISPNGP